MMINTKDVIQKLLSKFVNCWLKLMKNPKVIHRYRRQILLTVTFEIPLLYAFIHWPFHFIQANYQSFLGCTKNNGSSENPCKNVIAACLFCFFKGSLILFKPRWWYMGTQLTDHAARIMSNVHQVTCGKDHTLTWPNSANTQRTVNIFESLG